MLLPGLIYVACVLIRGLFVGGDQNEAVLSSLTIESLSP